MSHMDIDPSWAWVSITSGIGGLILGFVVRPFIAVKKWRDRVMRHKADLGAVEMVPPTFDQWERKTVDTSGYEWVGLPVTIRNNSQDKITNVSFGVWQRGSENDHSEAARCQLVMPGDSASEVAWTSISSNKVSARFGDQLIFFVRFDDADAKRWEGLFDIKAKKQWTVHRFD